MDPQSVTLLPTDFRSEDKNLQMLLAQPGEIKAKDYLKMYLYSFKELVFHNLLGQALSSESTTSENSCIMLLLESWLALVSNTPKQRPSKHKSDAGPLHFVAFLLKVIDELSNFAYDAKNTKSPAPPNTRLTFPWSTHASSDN